MESFTLPELSLNVPEKLVLRNVRKSIRRPLPQVQTYEGQTIPIALVGGGPSLEWTFDDLKEKWEGGMKVISMNGTHDWLLERGIRPSAHVMIDARAHNARFVQNPQKETKYLIASQCHPKVFDALEGYNVHIFHCFCVHDKEEEILNDYYMGQYFKVIGGSTVMLRAFYLFTLLGFRRFEVFGFDSCLMDGAHHAYKQKENDEEGILEVKVEGETFLAHTWMHGQAKEFMDISQTVGRNCDMIVHGDGLIAHIIKTCAKRLEVN